MEWSKVESAWAGLLLLGLLAVIGGACDARADDGQGDGQERPRWERCEGSGDWWALMSRGKQIGAYNEDTRQVAVVDPVSGRLIVTGERALSAAEARVFIELVQTPGVDVRRLAKEHRGYRLGDKFITEAEAYAALKPNPKMPADADAPSLTVIGSAEACQAVERDLERDPVLSAWKGLVCFQSYRPDDWQVSRSGFRVDGRPSIYFQAPGGEVLFRDDHYPGAEQLAAAVDKVYGQCCPKRDPVPDYQPEKDRPSRIVVHPQLEMPWGWIAGGACSFVLLAMMGLGALCVVFYLTRRPPAAPAVVQVVPAAPPAPPASGS